MSRRENDIEQLPSALCSCSRGTTLEHAAAHDADHRVWSRRDFLGSLLGASATLAFSMGPIPLFASSRYVRTFSNANPNRRFIIVQLIGGNDGLNTVVPVTNDLYYAMRPTLGIPKAGTWSLDDDFGMHGSTSPLRALWDQGEMAVIQGVGYPDSSLSHFRATDIWTAGSPEAVWSDRLTGWIGNALLDEYPDFATDQPEDPLAVRVGGPQPLLFESDVARMGIAIGSPEAFQILASSGTVHDPNDVPDSIAGRELSFVRQAANDALSYGKRIYSAAQVGHNQVEYPDTSFAQTLAIVAQLIKGGLKTQTYMVQLGGFDTHGNQITRQQELLGTLSSGLAAFFKDLSLDGWAKDTVAMTYSEFGRRPTENGSQGTDHGTSAPVFAFGPPVEGGLYGRLPELDELDEHGNLGFSVDFRSVYATILSKWMGLDASPVEELLGGQYDVLPFVGSEKTASHAQFRPGLSLLPNYPNPFSRETRITFELPEQTPVRLAIYDVAGREVRLLLDREFGPGRHSTSLRAEDLPSGSYIVQLTVNSGSRTQRITLAR